MLQLDDNSISTIFSFLNTDISIQKKICKRLTSISVSNAAARANSYRAFEDCIIFRDIDAGKIIISHSNAKTINTYIFHTLIRYNCTPLIQYALMTKKIYPHIIGNILTNALQWNDMETIMMMHNEHRIGGVSWNCNVCTRYPRQINAMMSTIEQIYNITQEINSDLGNYIFSIDNFAVSMVAAVVFDNYEYLAYLFNYEYEWNILAFICAYRMGNLRCLQFLHEHRPYDFFDIRDFGVKNAVCFQYMYDRGYTFGKRAFVYAIDHNNLEVLKLLIKYFPDEWDLSLSTHALYYGKYNCLIFLHDAGLLECLNSTIEDSNRFKINKFTL